MTNVCGDANGNITYIGNPANPCTPPASPPASLTFDETTNAALLADLQANTGLYKIVAGALQKSGGPVAVSAAAAGTNDASFVQANLAAIYTALRAGTATAAQTQRVLAFLLYQFIKG